MRVVITLGKAGKKEFSRARDYFKTSTVPFPLFGTTAAECKSFWRELNEGGINIGQEGKGRSVWLALGLILARGQSRVVASARLRHLKL
jgi:glucosyl-3-phosphoglycerate synthase